MQEVVIKCDAVPKPIGKTSLMDNVVTVSSQVDTTFGIGPVTPPVDVKVVVGAPKFFEDTAKLISGRSDAFHVYQCSGGAPLVPHGASGSPCALIDRKNPDTSPVHSSARCSDIMRVERSVDCSSAFGKRHEGHSNDLSHHPARLPRRRESWPGPAPACCPLRGAEQALTSPF